METQIQENAGMCSIPGLPSRGSSLSVLITRINLNPLCVLVEFWGNFDQDRKLAYQQMRKEIQYPRQVFHEAEGSPGDLCLVRIYETWYRARIVSRSDADYSVFLIDEGRTLHATSSILAWGHTDYFYLPPEVEFCVLANVLPLSHEKKWTKMALEYMKTFHGKIVTACVQDVVPQRTFLLDIPCLSKQMFEMGFAKKLSNEKFKDFVSRSLQSHSESVEPPITMTNKPFELLDQTGKQHCYMYPELQAETVETVIVTEVTNPLRVFCQLKVFSQELRKLAEQVTQYYEGRVGASFARPENLGTPCASRGSDGKWYRSVLQQVMPSNNVAEVLQVDYGKKQVVQVEHVRPLASEFFRMPVVTYVCSLHGIIDRGVGWTTSQIEFLKFLLLNRTVIARFEYQSPSEGLHYVTLYGDENTNINSLFGMREKCSMDSKALGDHVVHKNTTSQKSVGIEAEGSSLINLGDVKGNTSVFFADSLSPNTSHIAVVQHVDSPGKFWIQTQRYAEEFDQLMEGMEELYSDLASTEGLIRKAVPGLLCVAKSQDGVFYRATVCKVIDDKAEVFFLDYGNTEVVDCFNLRELPLRYQKLPALAIRCSLYGFQPSCEHWDQRSTLLFSKAVLDKVLDVYVLAKSNYTHVVRVTDPLADGEKDLSKLLWTAEFVEVVDPKKAVDKPVKHYTPKSKTCDVLETNTSQSSNLSSVTETRSVFKEYLFPIGSSVEVTVSYIESPSDFWCQKTRNAERLRVLMQELQDYYADSEFQPPLHSACVARHPENEMWYRAFIIQKHQTPHVTVLFVDYGQTRKVAIHDLRCIDQAFLKLNGQAFRCSLYNLIHPASHSPLDWCPDATSQFKGFVEKAASMNVVLTCTVYAVIYDAQKVVFNVVDLETPFQSVCSLLVQRGLAGHAPFNKAPIPPFRLDTYYYSTHGVKAGSEEDVSITSVKNVNQFFCHLGRNSAQIEELSDKVNTLCSQLENTACPKTFGKVCFAKYTDGLWYRAQITSTKPSIVVNFVDYGNTQEVEKSDLLPVPLEASGIMSVPIQAIIGGLSDMPENVPGEVNNWFESFVTDRPLKALVVAKEPSGKLIFELYDGKSQVNSMIREKFQIRPEKNEQITLKGYNSKGWNAQNGSHNVEKACLVSKTNAKHENNLHRSKWGKEPQRTSEDWRSQKETCAEPVESLSKSQDGNMRKRMASNHDGSVRESHCDSAKVSSAFAKSSTLKAAELPLKVINPGLEAEVFISHYNSHLDFFVQLLNDEDDIYSLVEKLNDDQSTCMAINPSDLHEGDLVSAVFPDDNSWYRAVVMKPPISEAVDVEFIDFGNTATVSSSQMRTLDGLLSLPRYSIHCSLAGITNADSEMASNLKKEIERNTERVTCTFIKLVGSAWEVKLKVNGVLLGSTFSSDATATVTPTDALKDSVPKHGLSSISVGTFYKEPDISDGLTVTGYASFISGPQLFWFQLAETDKLQEISDVIQKTGNAVESHALNDESLPIGSGCIALYSEDGLWYRAKVTSREHDTLSILFVDYGNESKVQMSAVRPLPCEVVDLPPQAFACQLDGFECSAGYWNDEAGDQFSDLITDQMLKVTVLKLGSLLDPETPHFVRLECGNLVINDAMKICWTENCSSLDLTNVPSVDSSVVIDIKPECMAESPVRPKDLPPTAAEDLPSDACTSTLTMQRPEVVCDYIAVVKEEQVESVFTPDESNDYMGIMPSQEELVVPDDLITKDNLRLTETSAGIENHDTARAKNSSGSPFPDVCIQSDVSETCGRAEFRRHFEREHLTSINHKNQMESTLQEDQFSEECTSILEQEESKTENNSEIFKTGKCIQTTFCI